MTWLYVPNCEPSPSAPGSEDLTLGFVWRCRTLARSVTWRGIAQPPRAWSRRWKQGGFIRLLSGLTCERSTLDHGVEQFISSLLAIHAKETQSLESGSATSMTAGCLTGQSTSFPPAGLVISSARTSRGTPMGNSPLLSKHWKDWAAALRAEYSARPKPATPCAASDCSSWPSATVTDANGARNATAVRSNPDSKHHSGTTLNDAVYNWAAPQARDHFPAHSPEYVAAKKQTWAAPKASDGEKGGPNQRGSKGDVPRPGQAAQGMTPMTADTGQKVTHATKQYSLIQQAERDFHLPSSPAPEIAGGSMSSTDSPNSNQPSVKRKLNPIFVEALMRWPTGLSGFERPETAWTRWLQLQHSYLLALASGYSPSQKGLFE